MIRDVEPNTLTSFGELYRHGSRLFFENKTPLTQHATKREQTGSGQETGLHYRKHLIMLLHATANATMINVKEGKLKLKWAVGVTLTVDTLQEKVVDIEL